MVATASLKVWAIEGEDSAAHQGRLVASALLNEGVVDVAGDSFKVAQDTGANMKVKVGSGTLGDLAAVSGDAAGQGLYMCEHQSATVTLDVAAADATNGRIDRVILRVYDDDADSSGNSYADVEITQGTPGAVPVAPDLVDGAISLATVEVDASVSAIVTADITDLRSEAKVREDTHQVWARHDYLVSDQSIPNTTSTTIIFSAVVFEEGVAMSRTSGVYTVEKAGYWRVAAQAAFASSVTGIREITILKGAVKVAAVRLSSVGGITYPQVVSPVVLMTASDTFTVQVVQTSGGALNVTGGQDDTWVSFEWIGPA